MCIRDSVIAVRTGVAHGDVVSVKDLLDDGRVVVYARNDEERVVEATAQALALQLRTGDHVVLDTRSGLITDRLARQESHDLLLEEVPNISYEDIGGLDEQIQQITDAVELPYLHRSLFSTYELPAPKGILLYGPPGCGKTLIAKAVAHSLSQKIAEVTGNANIRSYFLNICLLYTSPSPRD